MPFIYPDLELNLEGLSRVELLEHEINNYFDMRSAFIRKWSADYVDENHNKFRTIFRIFGYKAHVPSYAEEETVIDQVCQRIFQDITTTYPKGAPGIWRRGIAIWFADLCDHGLQVDLDDKEKRETYSRTYHHQSGYFLAISLHIGVAATPLTEEILYIIDGEPISTLEKDGSVTLHHLHSDAQRNQHEKTY